MTNMVPQDSMLNQGAWENLESFTRTLLQEWDREVYIYDGVYGESGRLSRTGRDWFDDRFRGLWSIGTERRAARELESELEKPDRGYRTVDGIRREALQIDFFASSGEWRGTESGGTVK